MTLIDVWIGADGAILEAGEWPGVTLDASPSASRAAFAGHVVVALLDDGRVRGAHVQRGLVRSIHHEAVVDAETSAELSPAWAEVRSDTLTAAEPLTSADLSSIAGRSIAIEVPAPTADDVRREAQRRMMALAGARTADHLTIVIANGTREAVRLLRIKDGRAWTSEEASRAAQLEQLDLMIEAIRVASNELEPSPPADYASDDHWPNVPPS